MKKYFLIGIKGKGMQALAKYLSMQGNKVEGYDVSLEQDSIYSELEKIGIKIYDNYEICNSDDYEIIVTPAIPADKLQKINHYKYYNDFIAEITKNNNTICVAGSFGKTTTSTFLFQILNNIIGCNCIIGDGTGFYNRKNDMLVLESCEFKRHFLDYNPNDVIITNIGLEHTDCYKDLDEIITTFVNFSNKSSHDIIVYGDMDNIDYSIFKKKIYKYGFLRNNDVVIKNYNYLDNTTNIVLLYKGKECTFKVPIILLKHQILDLVACITFCLLKSYNVTQMENSLQCISLPKYRIVRENINGIDVIWDYCGHYAGIKNNIEEIKKIYSNKKIKVIYEPISYNRVINTLDFICDALKLADYVYICDIYPLRESKIEQYNFSAENIIEKVKNSKYWNKEQLLYFNDNDLVLIFAPVSINQIKNKIRKK